MKTVSAESDPPPATLRITWLGQSGFLLEWEGRRLVLDPYLSDSLTRKYSGTNKPHVALAPPLMAPEALTGIDVVTSSHNHTDHLDAETLVPMRRANPGMQLVIPRVNLEFVRGRLGEAMGEPVLLGVGESATVAGFTIHAVPAAHNELGPEFLGYVIEAGDWRVYHSGDTLRFPGMEEGLRCFGHFDFALLPINGDRPERRVAGNLDGRQAAELAFAIGAGCVVPCHYDMFAFNTADPAEFVARCEELGQPFLVLRVGEAVVHERH